MKNIDVVKKAIFDTISENLIDYYELGTEVTYRQFINDVYDGDAKRFKDDVVFTINNIDNELDKEPSLTDDNEIELENGEFVKYVKVLNEIKSKFF